MSKIRTMFFILVLIVAPASAQAPTGTIAGVVTNSSGANVTRARVSICNRATGLTRELTTSSDEFYSASALPSGVYSVTGEAPGFSVLERAATVEAGTTTTVDLTLQAGGIKEISTINAPADASEVVVPELRRSEDLDSAWRTRQ